MLLIEPVRKRNAVAKTYKSRSKLILGVPRNKVVFGIVEVDQHIMLLFTHACTGFGFALVQKFTKFGGRNSENVRAPWCPYASRTKAKF